MYLKRCAKLAIAFFFILVAYLNSEVKKPVNFYQVKDVALCSASLENKTISIDFNLFSSSYKSADTPNGLKVTSFVIDAKTILVFDRDETITHHGGRYLKTNTNIHSLLSEAHKLNIPMFIITATNFSDAYNFSHDNFLGLANSNFHKYFINRCDDLLLKYFNNIDVPKEKIFGDLPGIYWNPGTPFVKDSVIYCAFHGNNHNNAVNKEVFLNAISSQYPGYKVFFFDNDFFYSKEVELSYNENNRSYDLNIFWIPQSQSDLQAPMSAHSYGQPHDGEKDKYKEIYKQWQNEVTGICLTDLMHLEENLLLPNLAK